MAKLKASMRAFSTKWGQHREETSLAAVQEEGLQVGAAQTIEYCRRDWSVG